MSSARRDLLEVLLVASGSDTQRDLCHTPGSVPVGNLHEKAILMPMRASPIPEELHTPSIEVVQHRLGAGELIHGSVKGPFPGSVLARVAAQAHVGSHMPALPVCHGL